MHAWAYKSVYFLKRFSSGSCTVTAIELYFCSTLFVCYSIWFYSNHFLCLCKALWIASLFDMCYINKASTCPCLNCFFSWCLCNNVPQETLANLSKPCKSLQTICRTKWSTYSEWEVSVNEDTHANKWFTLAFSLFFSFHIKNTKLEQPIDKNTTKTPLLFPEIVCYPNRWGKFSPFKVLKQYEYLFLVIFSLLYSPKEYFYSLANFNIITVLSFLFIQHIQLMIFLCVRNKNIWRRRRWKRNT